MNDVLKHIIAGFIVGAIVGLPAYLDSGNLFAGVWPALTSGCIAGAVKEWCDNKYEWQWSWKGLGWTCLGAVLAAVFIVLLHFAKG
jgi:fructose-specific phosphotransferase system IIC component